MANTASQSNFAGLVCGGFVGGIVFSFEFDASPVARRFAAAMGFCGLCFVILTWVRAH